jgi:hypothetical protein
MAHVVACLPRKHETLSPNPSMGVGREAGREERDWML